MPKITFVAADGRHTETTIQNGQSIMSAAVDAGIEEIIAECGGACACGTCHCRIDAAWFHRLPSPQRSEQDMLDFVANPTEFSRLSCQIKMSDSLDGLVVHLPATQY